MFLHIKKMCYTYSIKKVGKNSHESYWELSYFLYYFLQYTSIKYNKAVLILTKYKEYSL